jgi:hypothetical protein
MTTAQMEQPQTAAIGALVLIGAVILVLRARGGAGNGEPPPGNGGTVEGETRLAGQVGSVMVNQRRKAAMGRHLLTKAFGSPVNLSVTITTSARTPSGGSLGWPWRIRARLGHNIIFPIPGWRTSGQLGFSEDGERLQSVFQGSRTTTVPITQAFLAPDDPDQEWDVRIELQAQRSNSNGQPIANDWIVVATGEHPGAILTVAGTTQLTGAVGAVDVSQANRPRAIRRVRPGIKVRRR